MAKNKTSKTYSTDSITEPEIIDLENNEFKDVWRLLNYTNRSVFMTGKAGTGKSTFLKYIVSNTKKRNVVLAPTGIAAVNAGGQTLHSFFKLPFKPVLPDDPDFAVKVLRKRLKYSSSHVKLIERLELIVIDEISMVRSDTIDLIDKILRVYSRNMRQPFGGKQLLFVGDVFQLEPVVTGDTRDILAHYYKGPYFFNASVFNELAMVPIELTKVYRQDQDIFIKMLDRIRIGKPSANDIELLNSRVVKNNIELNIESNPKSNNAADDYCQNQTSMTITIATKRDMVDHINQKHLDALPTPLHTYVGKIEGDFPANSLPTDMNLIVKVGAQVVFIKNDPEKRWVNGTVGIIDSIYNDHIIVKIENGDKTTLVPHCWANIKYVYDEKKKTVDEIELGTFTQYPIKLAWALTIHKSQGLTFNNVIIDIGSGAFTGGQTYVALSRCRSLDGISLHSTVNARDIYVNPSVVDFANKFNNQNLLSEAIETTRADVLYHDAVKAFDKGMFSNALKYVFEAMSIRNDFNSELTKRFACYKVTSITKMQKRINELEKQIKDNQLKFKTIAQNLAKLGNDCAESGEQEAAIANYERALEFAPDLYDAIWGLGLVCSESGNTDRAIELLEKASQIAPDNILPLLTLGDIYVSLNDYAAAMGYYLHAHDLTPKNKRVLRRIIDIYEAIGDDDSANHYRNMLNKP